MKNIIIAGFGVELHDTGYLDWRKSSFYVNLHSIHKCVYTSGGETLEFIDKKMLNFYQNSSRFVKERKNRKLFDSWALIEASGEYFTNLEQVIK